MKYDVALFSISAVIIGGLGIWKWNENKLAAIFFLITAFLLFIVSVMIHYQVNPLYPFIVTMSSLIVFFIGGMILFLKKRQRDQEGGDDFLDKLAEGENDPDLERYITNARHAQNVKKSAKKPWKNLLHFFRKDPWADPSRKQQHRKFTLSGGPESERFAEAALNEST